MEIWLERSIVLEKAQAKPIIEINASIITKSRSKLVEAAKEQEL